MIKSKYVVKIRADLDPMSPRDWDNYGTVVDWAGSRYQFGDEHYVTVEGLLEDLIEEVGAWDSLEKDEYDDGYLEELQGVVKQHYVVLPIYAYVHSGMTISTSAFGCPWDSGLAGYIYAKIPGTDEEISEDQVRQILESEVKVLDQYLRGDVWGFEVYKVDECDLGHEHEELIDSCWGFYGDTLEETGISEHIDNDYISPDELEEAWEDRTYG